MNQLFIQDPSSNRIRITQRGIAKYGSRFAKAGFDIKKIRTIDEFRSAVDASFALEMQNLATTAKGQNNELDEILSGLPGWEK